MATGNVMKLSPIDDAPKEEMTWLTSSSLSIVVVGASGDLAKKKTYPSLLNLYDDNLLPKDTLIWGFARSSLTDNDLRDRLRPYQLLSAAAEIGNIWGFTPIHQRVFESDAFGRLRQRTFSRNDRRFRHG